jgi:hypothetical protein
MAHFKNNYRKNLLITTALGEFITGIMLVTIPSAIATLLLGSSINTTVSLTIARIAGVALMTLGAVCWVAHNDHQSIGSKGLVAAITFYNTGVLAVLIYATTRLGLSGIGFWPVVLFHVAMDVWCIMSLLNRPKKE